MAQQDIVDNGKLILVVGGGTLVTIALVLAVQGLYYIGAKEQHVLKEEALRPSEIVSVVDAQNNELNGWKVITRSGSQPDKVQIPIDRAMSLVKEELAKK